MDIRKVKKLIELLEESGIAEIEISEGEESVRISRYPAGGAHAAPVVHYAPAPMAPVAAAPQALAARRRGSGRRRACAGRQGRPHRDCADGRHVLLGAPRRAPRRSSTSAAKSTSATRCASSKP